MHELPKRYKFEGHRPGEKHVGPHSVVETDPVDGGAVLTEAVADHFRKQGKVLTEVGKRPNDPGVTVARENGLNDTEHPNATTVAERTGKTTDPDLAVRGKKGELSDANANVTPEKVEAANKEASDENARATAAANAAAVAANNANDRRAAGAK